MKRLPAGLFICAYLGILCFGVVSHALGFRNNAHFSMYYIVWDMFCGWSAYESRTHVIAEGESGRFYQVAPGPWKTLQPFGNLTRENYDPFMNYAVEIGLHTLKNTQHEPVARIYVVEEAWAKRFNLPDSLWSSRYPEPKQHYSYFHLRRVADSNGRILNEYANFLDYQSNLCLSDNPRLWHDAQKGRPFFDIELRQRGFEQPSPSIPVDAASQTAQLDR